VNKGVGVNAMDEKCRGATQRGEVTGIWSVGVYCSELPVT